MNKNISDIARMAGVAKSTVSRYLNGGSVSAKTKQKLERITREAGYVPNTFAQSLKAKRNNLIGTIVPRLDSFAAAQTMTGIDEELREAGGRMLVYNAGQDRTRELEAMTDLARQKVSGIILMPAQVTEEHLRTAEAAGIPVLLIGQSNPALHSLVYDDYRAGLLMGRHVLDMGHRRIAYLGVTEEDEAVGLRRKEGFRAAAQECEDCEIFYYESSFKIEDARLAAERILDECLPSLIVCATDNIALGVMKTAHMRGLSVPSELSITGFGGYEVTGIIHPALTTVRFPYYEAGRLAARSMLRLTAGEEVKRLTVIDVELLPQESVDNLNTASV
ncbi:LacI family DNA-binding transcriptional regulator [Saccharibacillus alkalitolerans]|uniref:LacI family transcriptional regulator n=1 Tax=Saccharibacillus alkalitolerans TaxID=2705290 RepID=A0ABX0F8T9_9BACL|nr:LacI family DNA-binding transcriptional regulator [Saccharibacillus alkalitolerans]NGZ75899.1 LacI family transcriptional regulator [Saccharibacillus alkalitolerans]